MTGVLFGLDGEREKKRTRKKYRSEIKINRQKKKYYEFIATFGRFPVCPSGHWRTVLFRW